MRNPFTALFRARDKPQDSVSAAPTFYFGTSGSGKSVNANTAIQLSTVYACVRVISETVASLPLGVYEAKEDGNRKATEHPLYPLLHSHAGPPAALGKQLLPDYPVWPEPGHRPVSAVAG